MLVPFGSNEKIGFVVDFATKISLKTVKPILGLLDDQPAVTSGQMELAVWMAAYYATPLGMMLKAMLPSILTRIAKERVTLLDSLSPTGNSREQRIIEFLEGRGAISTDFLRRTLEIGSIRKELRSLASEGMIEIKTG